MNNKKAIILDINNMLANINCSPELFHDGIDLEIKDLLYEIKNYLNKDDKSNNIDNLINMMKEFDYKKNGKEATLNFLIIMFNNFADIENWK
jgi:uncharacterized protein YxeA